MTASTSSIQGLASGIQWQDMIDQLIAVDTANELTPLQTKAAAETKSQTAWGTYGSLVSTLQSAAAALGDGSALGTLTVNVPNSSSTSRSLLTATALPGAATGTTNVQVLATASSQQLSGNVVADPTAALGANGQFLVGGKVVTVANSDSLNSLRDKINALNTGSTPTNVSASILYSGSNAARLVLTTSVGGSAGVDIRDARATSSDPSMLTQLGFNDGGSTVNTGSDGAVRSASFTSPSIKIAAMAMGVSVYPEPAAVTVNGRTITVDLEHQSLTEIAAMINAQTPNTASVETVTNGSSTAYRLKISGTVAATGDAGSQPTLDLLGITRGTTGVVQQQVTTSNALYGADDNVASSSTGLLGLKLSGGTGAASGDTFTITGTKADGVTKVSLTESVDGTKTLQDLLNDIGSAFSATGRPVTASLVDGKIRLTDTTGGDSGLSFSIAADNAGGGTLAFGAANATTVGRQREIAAGTDARLLVNGVSITRSSNTISDAIPGVTLKLQQAEVGTTIPVSIGRDDTRVSQTLQALAQAYNAVQTFVTTSTATGGDLAFNGAVRQSFNSIKNSLFSPVGGLAAGSQYTSAALVGLMPDKSGKLSLDQTVLSNALATNPDAVKALFQTGGTTTNDAFSYVGSDTRTSSGNYDIQITRAATQASLASTAANFVYSGGVNDVMTIGESVSGKGGTISLVNGDTPDTVAAKLNTLFTAQGMRVSAENVNGVLAVHSLDYGHVPTITTSFSSPETGAALGLASGVTQNGLDVQGSFHVGSATYAATGAGQLLTGDAGSPTAGLSVSYSGTTTTAGHVDFTLGLGGLAGRLTSQVSDANSGIVSQQVSTLQTHIDALTSQQTSVQARLDARRTALTAQFTAMETALSQIQAQGNWLTQQINSMNSSGSGS